MNDRIMLLDIFVMMINDRDILTARLEMGSSKQNNNNNNAETL